MTGIAITQKGINVIERMALDPTYRFPGLGPMSAADRRMVLDTMWRRDWYHRGEARGWWER